MFLYKTVLCKAEWEVEKFLAEPNIIGESKHQRLHLIGHLKRKEDDRDAKKRYLGTPKGRRSIGHLKFLWKDEPRKDSP